MNVEERDQQSFQIEGDSSVPVGPGMATSFDPTTLDFGHYAGHTIVELARIDSDYLRWLERHPSGVRYRTEIHRVLGEVPTSIRWDR